MDYVPFTVNDFNFQYHYVGIYTLTQVMIYQVDVHKKWSRYCSNQ